MRISSLLRKAVAVIICLIMTLSFATMSYAEDGSNAGTAKFSSISKTRFSMTDKQMITAKFNLGAGTAPENLEWYFGDIPFAEWISQSEEEGQVFTVVSTQIDEDGEATAVIAIDYLFDGPDAAYWRPYWDYRGTYDLKVTDKTTNKSAVQSIDYEVYDSYHYGKEVDEAVKEIIDNKTNDIYMSYESTGKSTDGRDVNVAIVAKDKEAVDKWLALKERAEKEPEKVIAEIEAGTLTDYQVPVYITNIHANEPPGIDGQIEFLREIANETVISYKDENNEDALYNVEDILESVFFIVRPTENPYALETYSRGNSEGFDLNRDNTYQTQIESQVATADIVKWDPVTLIELHGFIYGSRTQVMVEPCTPPHEPNLEYDLFMNYALEGARAFGAVASLNSGYTATQEHVDTYKGQEGFEDLEVGDPWYEICIEENLVDGRWEYPSDDMSTNYTPTYAQFHGTIGYTIECGELNQKSTDMHKYGIIGHTAYVAENKEALFKNQLEFFKRANANEESEETEKWFVDQDNNVVKDFREKNENGKFYPEYYVIPVDYASQRDIADAYEMQNYLVRNGVLVEKLTEDVAVDGVTYKKGSFVVDLHQAKRSMANAVLYKGVRVLDWTGLYSESVTNFPEMRGFDCTAITKAGVFEGKTEDANTPYEPLSIVNDYGKVATVIENDGVDSVNAVNDLLRSGVKVGFITEGGDHYAKGDFVVDYKDFEKISSEYALKINNIANVPKAKYIIEPKLYLTDDIYDQFAFTKQMNFNTVEDVSEANVMFSSSTPDDAAKAEIAAGLPFIGASCYIMDYAKEVLPGFDFAAEGELDYWGDFVWNDNEALFKVDYAKDNLITSSNIADDDYVIYTKGGATISQVPEGATKLITAQSGDDFYIAGWWNGIEEELKGQTVAIDYQKDGLNMTIFSTSITNRAHQTDDYRLATNAIYSKLLSGDFVIEGYMDGGDTPQNPDLDKSDVSGTGDQNNGVIYFALLLACAAIGGIAVKRRRDI